MGGTGKLGTISTVLEPATSKMVATEQSLPSLQVFNSPMNVRSPSDLTKLSEPAAIASNDIEKDDESHRAITVDGLSSDSVNFNCNVKGSGAQLNNFPNFLLTYIRSISCKADELETTLHITNIDIVATNETWLNDSIPHELSEIGNYKCYRRNRRDGRRGGGLCSFVRSELSVERLYELDSPDIESLWLLYRARRVPRRVSHIAIGVYYHPLDGENRRALQHIIESADYIKRVHP